MDPEHRDRLTATIGLLTTDEQTRRRVIEIAQPFGEVLTTRAWRDFVNMVEPADCAVIDIGHSDVTLAAWPALINERLATELILIVPSLARQCPCLRRAYPGRTEHGTQADDWGSRSSILPGRFRKPRPRAHAFACQLAHRAIGRMPFRRADHIGEPVGISRGLLSVNTAEAMASRSEWRD